MSKENDPSVRLMRTTKKRNFNAHHLLLKTAKVTLNDAKKKPEYQLTTMVMCAFAVEALCNSVGSLLIEEWDDWKSTLEKLKILTDELNIEYDEKAEPWSTAVWIQTFRNDVAHSKPEYVIEEKIITEEMFERSMPFPKSKLEKQVTYGNAERAYKQVKEIKNLLCLAVPTEKAFGLFADATSASTGHIK